MSKDHGYHIPFENIGGAGHFDVGCPKLSVKIKKINCFINISSLNTEGLNMVFLA